LALNISKQETPLLIHKKYVGLREKKYIQNFGTAASWEAATWKTEKNTAG